MEVWPDSSGAKALRAAGIAGRQGSVGNMGLVQFLMLLILCVFYITYAVKMLLLKRRGIQGNLLGKGDKPEGAKIVELLLNLFASIGTIIQFGSALLTQPAYTPAVYIPGLVLTFLGMAFFVVSVVTMRDNWRAGFDEQQKTHLVTRGIYRISRNPAFAGFDLLYIGCALVFPFWLNIAAAIASLVLFHVQIMGEEQHLAKTFGAEYAVYKAKVMRYLGRKPAR